MLTTREAILFKVESTYKQDSNPSPSTDAILVSDLNVANENLRMVDRPIIRPSLATEKKIFAGTLKKATFTVEVKGSGTAGTPPEIGQLLRCSGLGETIVANTSVSYQPVSDGIESGTLKYYQDGRLKILLGCRGTATFNGETGGIGKFTFELTGHDGGISDALFPTLTYDTAVPVPMINLGFSIDSYAAVINALTLDFANSIAVAPSMNDEWGYGEVRITMRDPNGTIDPEAVLVATKNFDALLKSGNVVPLTTGNVGTVAGNIWKLDANVALRDIAQGEREQIRTDELTFGCHEVTTDDEFTLTFT